MQTITAEKEKVMEMREKLMDIVCESIATDNCIAHCNHPHCGMVQTIVQNLIANGITIQKWIPVTERLPEKDGKYLLFEQRKQGAYIDTIYFAKDARKIDRYDFKDNWKNVWYDYDNEWGYYTVDTFTHWMPLPEPPKEENHA